MRTPRAAVGVREIVGFLLRRGDLERRGGDGSDLEAGLRAHAPEARLREPGYRAEVTLRVTTSEPQIRIAGRADAVISHGGAVTVEEIKSTDGPLERLGGMRDPDPLEALGLAHRPVGDAGGRLLDWAQGVCYAAMYRALHGAEGLRVRLRYVSARDGEHLVLHRSYGGPALDAALDALARRYGAWVARADAWERARDASLASLDLPFAVPRPGQEDLVAAVERAIERGERLFAQAPTGIGKTVAVLLPSLRSLGPRGLRRVFYLTPRGTTARAALGALEALRGHGARARVILLQAREKLCAHPGAGCEPAFCPRARGHHDRLLGALEDLLDLDTLDAAAVSDCAARHRVCPHELRLDASTWCDLIVGDYNYVFDPRVALRRFLDPEVSPPQEQLYLVDEAHDLVDRAREMYSAELLSPALVALARDADAVSPALAAAARDVLAVLPSVAEACGEAVSEGELAVGVSEERPEALVGPLEAFAAAAREAFAAGEVPRLAPGCADTVFELLALHKALERFDTAYALVVRARGAELETKVLCVDPSRQLAERLGLARASVFFSATLSPLEHYASLLGGGEQSSFLSLPSPFPRENLVVVVDRSVSTRYRDRPATLARAARTIAVTASAKAGSYLAFAPSFEYLQALHAAFREAAPAFRTLLQRPSMADGERREFLAELADHGLLAAKNGGAESLVGFAVLGGLFGEGVDLPGEGLIGAVVVGVGLPRPEAERELIRRHHEEHGGDGFGAAYVIPALGRVLQAAGRVIRSDTDRGVVVLVDDRFASLPYRELLPSWWEPREVRGSREVARELAAFWEDLSAEACDTSSPT